MRQPKLLALLIGLVITGQLPPVAAQEPRQIVEEAVKAAGGLAQLRQIKAVRYDIKGSFHELNDATMTGQIQTQLPRQYRLTHQVETEGVRIVHTEVLNGDKAWSREQGEKLEELAGSNLLDMRQSAYVDYVASLVPLLSDKGYELSALPPAKINEKDAIGLKVTYKGWPDIKLYFSKETKELVKVENRRIYPDTGKEVLWEEFRNDYRPVSPAAADLKLLKAENMANEGLALLAYVQKQTLTEDDQKRIRGLIGKLGDDAFAVREKARTELLTFGPKAFGLLEEASKSTDAEVSRTAKDCMSQMGKGHDPFLLQAVIRLLGHHRPPDTIKTLIDYLACSPNEEVNQEILAVLATIAVENGKPDPAFAKIAESGDAKTRQYTRLLLGKEQSDSQKPLPMKLFLPGVKWPMKGTLHRDGKKISEWEVLSVRFFTGMDESAFAKP